MELWEFSNISISALWNCHRFSPLYRITLDIATFLSAKSIFQTLSLAVKTIELYKMQKISQVPPSGTSFSTLASRKQISMFQTVGKPFPALGKDFFRLSV